MGHAYLIMEIPKPQYLTNRFPCNYGAVDTVFHVHNSFRHLNLLLVCTHGSIKATPRFQQGAAKHYPAVQYVVKSIHVSEEDQHGDETLDIMSSHCVLCDRSFGSEDPLEQHLRDSLIHQQGSGNPFGCLLPLLPNVSL